MLRRRAHAGHAQTRTPFDCCPVKRRELHESRAPRSLAARPGHLRPEEPDVDDERVSYRGAIYEALTNRRASIPARGAGSSVIDVLVLGGPLRSTNYYNDSQKRRLSAVGNYEGGSPGGDAQDDNGGARCWLGRSKPAMGGYRPLLGRPPDFAQRNVIGKKRRAH